MQTFSMSEEVEVVVVGGGQAGVAMSEHLGNAGVPHVVLERGRIAEKWRSGRWDSLVANGPAWHDRFPGLEFDGDPAAFVPKEQVADYFAAYAQKIGAPIRCGVDVTSVQKNAGAPGFRVQTSHGAINARFVVAATGPFQRPVIPPIGGGDTVVTQLHSAVYRNPGHTVDFRDLAAQGITLVGRTTSLDHGRVRFAADLRDNIAAGDANYLSLLDEADAYIARNGLDLPAEPHARVFAPDPDRVSSPLRELDLAAAGVTSIVWATGYATDFGWLQVDAFDDNGRPRHQRGVSSEPGVYFLGLPWLSRRGSSFIWGVWHDAKYIADQISIQRGYAAYRD